MDVVAHGWFWAVLRRWSAKSEFPNPPSCSFLRICATALFFRVTEMVKGSMRQLAAVEATQSMEVLFTTAGEVIWLSASLPTPLVGGASAYHAWNGSTQCFGEERKGSIPC
ncbi:multidrug resistance efflux transporter family protein [Brevibacillus laterosporus]|uniref:multidrug resistance efflux transporter family protein n=1 Tax=Brevibacillus laterosporus TaxID=1465 RepID=UPI0022A70CE8|nr:multidrug resistance efflux transporter family protein [Brevibacillus laterosporus]MCZ0843616.1 multidrug resistance efflux transporter family protein [Brevibacillus laterosporus]